MNLELSAQDFVARRDPTRENGIGVYEEKKVLLHAEDDHVEIGRNLCLPNPRDVPYIIYLPAPPPTYIYDLPPTDMLIGAFTSTRTFGLADAFGGGYTIYRNSNESQPSGFYDPNIEPDWIFYSGGGHGIINRVSLDNSQLFSVVDAYHQGFSGSGDILKMVLVPTGHLLAWGRMVFTSGAQAQLRRWAWPTPAPSTANGTTIYIAPGGIQGSSQGSMTIDYERGMVYLAHGTRNSSAGLYRCAWDGSISSVILGWSNGVIAPQPVPTSIVYVPRDDRIYYIITSNIPGNPINENERYVLWSIRPDGTGITEIAVLNLNNLSQHSYSAMAYNAAADMLYIAINENDRRGIIEAFSRQGVRLGTIASIPSVDSFYDIHLTNLAA